MKMSKENNKNINELDDHGCTPLIHAVKNGDLKSIQELLNSGANVNTCDKEDNSPLHWAAYKKSYEIAELLLNHHADLHAKDQNFFTPSFYPAMSDDLPMLELFYHTDKTILTATAFFGGTLLHYAASDASLKVIEFLLARDLEIDARSLNKETPLEWGMYRGQVDVIDLLVQHGAKVKNIFDIWGNSVLTAAILANNTECIHALIKRGADVNEVNSEGRTPLHTAVSPANERITLKMVQLLIELGADVNAVKKDGVSVLMWAVKYGTPEIVRCLLEKGASVDPTVSNPKYSVLHNALSTNNVEIIDLIIDIATVCDFKDESGKTPLLLAVEKGNLNSIKKLISKKVSIHSVDGYFGKTPLHQAALCGYDDIAAYLLTMGADLDAKDKENRTSLFYAEQYGHSKTYDILNHQHAEKNISKALNSNTLLSQHLKSEQAHIWYLGHSGWAIKTQNHLLIFDYASNTRIPINASIINGYIVPEELKNMTVTVFVSYLCPDHFDPQIYEWGKTINNCTFVYAFDPNKITPYMGPEYVQMRLNQTKIINEIEVTTLLSNVGGTGYLVTVDGLTIFHPGDHSEREADHSGPYCQEIDFIANQNKAIDIAFLPIQGDYLADRAIVNAGNEYAIRQLSPSVVFPMHADGKEHLYDHFINKTAPKFPSVRFVSSKNRGDHYFYN